MAREIFEKTAGALAGALLLCMPALAETVFENVTVLAMDGSGVVEGLSVVVEDDRIISVADLGEFAVSDDATIIDGEGRYLIPGLGEMHGHIPPVLEGEQAVNDILFLYLSNGVTTVRGMLGSPGQLQLREEVLSGERVSPTLYLAGPSFNGNSIRSPEQATRRVEQQVEEGWDLLKVHPGLTRDEYDAMAEKANALAMDFGGHVPAEVGLVRALEAGQRTLDHLDGLIIYLGGETDAISEDAMRAAARLTRDAGTGVVPTSALWITLLQAADRDELFSVAGLDYMPADTVASWRSRFDAGSGEAQDVHVENRRRLLKILHEEGVELLFGTDAPQVFSVPGFSIHREIEEMEAAGLSEADILISATSAIGTYFADKDTFGVIAPGARADLVLLEANPMEDLSALKDPAGVMYRGNWLSREAIQQELAAIAERAG